MPHYIDTSNIASGKKIVAQDVRGPLEALDAKIHQIENWPKVDITSGPADAGKLVKLNASGVIDGSMIPGVDWEAWQASQRSYHLAFGNPHVHKGYGNEFSLSNYTGMRLYLNSGAALVDGVPYIQNTQVVLTFDPAHATLDRVDAIVLRRNPNYTVTPMVLKGTPAASPRPAPHQSNDELLWWLTVKGGAQSVTSANANDQRIIHDPTDIFDEAFISGEIRLYAGTSLPAGWLWCDGREVQAKLAPRLCSVLGWIHGVPSSGRDALAYTNDNIYSPNHGLVVGDAIWFPSQTMPGGLTAYVVYYVREVIDANHFNISLVPGGAKVDITTEQHGLTFYSTFKLPDLRGRFPLGKDNMGGTSANRVTASQADSIGGAAGAENVTLTVAQIPSHDHRQYIFSPPYHRLPATYRNIGSSGTTILDTAVKNTTESAANPLPLNTGTAGSGQAHNNMPPYVTLNYIIRLF